MTLDRLMTIVDEGYGGDGHILAYHGDLAGEHGDGLEAFIAREITENFLPDREGEKAQLEDALRLMENAALNIHNVIAALQAALLACARNRK